MGRDAPLPISLKKPQRKKKVSLSDTPVQPFNMDAPEHKTRIVKRIVKDKALEARVTRLEGADAPEIIVNLPDRPRIERISIEYDSLGHPKALVPSYGA
jgi:hypothetical protein